MKKILLLICGMSVLLAGKLNAQSFVPQSGTKDTMTAYYHNGEDELFVNNYLKSTSANPVYVRWHVTSYNLSTGWGFDGFCDNNTCYPMGVLSGGNQVSNAYSQSYGDFHVIFSGLNSVPVGSFSYVKANVRDTVSGSSRDLTFIGYKAALGVTSTITSYDDVTLFPNPAREAVNVIFDEKAGVKTIAIYNLIGKVLNVYKPTDNGSAKLDIDNIPAGVYFLRLMDGKGHILATRRFTRQ